MSRFACVNCDHEFDSVHMEAGAEFLDEDGYEDFEDDTVAGDCPVCDEMTPAYEL